MNSALDSCVALKWVLAEPDSAKALQLLDDFQTQVRLFLAPDVFPLEVAHALTRAARRGLITPQEGSAKFSDILASLPDMYPSLPLLPRAYDLSSTFRIGVYDCLYVALAEREGCELITADNRLVQALQPAFPFITALSARP